jgi:DNA-directed RNA polymerase subunit H (RpoH/RPB5)
VYLSTRTAKPPEEEKAKVLIELRHYKLLKRKEYKNGKGLFVKTPRGKVLMFLVSTKGTVGVMYVNQLMKALEEENLESGIIVTSGRYTQAAKKKAAANNIELIPRIFPAFNLFTHELVPKHEILTPNEREELLAKYRIQPYQMPKIWLSDPAVRAVGAQIGDVVRIVRDSTTAGEYIAYRYVVEG